MASFSQSRGVMRNGNHLSGRLDGQADGQSFQTLVEKELDFAREECPTMDTAPSLLGASLMAPASSHASWLARRNFGEDCETVDRASFLSASTGPISVDTFGPFSVQRASPLRQREISTFVTPKSVGAVRWLAVAGTLASVALVCAAGVLLAPNAASSESPETPASPMKSAECAVLQSGSASML